MADERSPDNHFNEEEYLPPNHSINAADRSTFLRAATETDMKNRHTILSGCATSVHYNVTMNKHGDN
eukprot:4288137-Amphidinium_carterae.1